MTAKTFTKIALVSAIVVVAGLWAYNKFPAFQRAVGGGSNGSSPVRKVA